MQLSQHEKAIHTSTVCFRHLDDLMLQNMSTQPRHSAVLFPIFVEGGLCCKITLLLLRILVNWESKLNGKTYKKYR